jgi:hypothetical protein
MGHNKAGDRRKEKKRRFLRECKRLKRKKEQQQRLWLLNVFQKRFERVD